MDKNIKSIVKKSFIIINNIIQDKAVLFGFSNKFWIFISSAVTAPIIIIYFTPTLQGFYYTFIGVLGIQSLFVLGLGQLLQQFISHEWIKINHLPGKGFEGDSQAILKLSNIKQFTIKWFSILSLLLFLSLSIGGYFFMKQTSYNSGIPISFWLAPWLVISFLKSLQLFISPGVTFLEGINEVENVNRFRFSQSLQERISTWIIIIIGGKLWLFSSAACINILGQFYFFKKKYSSILNDLIKLKSIKNDIWKREILPLQWKYAVSSLSGYLNFSFIVPLIFWFLGPVTAGQMGITWAIITMFWGLSVTIITTKIPTFAMDAANKDYKKLDKLFFNSTLVSTIFLVITSVLLLLIIIITKIFYPEIYSRFLPLLPFTMFSLSIIPHHFKFAMTSYMRALKKEPFWKISIIESILIVFIIPLFCKYAGIEGVSISFLGIIILITCLTYFKFNRIKNEMIC
ncbi:MAG: hypothetical protein IIB83_01425 [Bacteroidetes bacterium]|nr:hypothetical protein [Bacteroidota bacterium]